MTDIEWAVREERLRHELAFRRKARRNERQRRLKDQRLLAATVAYWLAAVFVISAVLQGN